MVIALLLSLALMQFYHPAKNNNTTLSPNHISQMYAVPVDVQKVLQKACYDCHSNSTVYPWYSYVQPVSWWLTDHIKEGKKRLNYAEFGTYTLLKQSKKLKEVITEIKEDEMPLCSYTFIHQDAVLTPKEKQAVIQWATQLSGDIYNKVPAAEIEEERKREAERENNGNKN